MDSHDTSHSASLLEKRAAQLQNARKIIPNPCGALTLVITVVVAWLIYIANNEDSEQTERKHFFFYMMATIAMFSFTGWIWVFSHLYNTMVRMGKKNHYPSYQIWVAFGVVALSLAAGAVVAFFPVNASWSLGTVILAYLLLYPLANQLLIRTCDEKDAQPLAQK
jgi:peptidoglycan/LPS O-acetylase OafA/YrhL